MKLNKLFLFAAVAIVSLMSSCSSDDDFTPGNPAGSNNVFFADNNNVTMALTQKSFEVTLERADAGSALTVPVEVVSADDIFTISTTKVEFASGAKTATISVNVSDDMKLNTAYQFTLRIPEEYTNPYVVQSVYPVYSVNVMKEDYEVFSKAVYMDMFETGQQWDVTIEYSPAQDLYRVKDMFEPGTGYDFYFKWNKETNVITPTNAAGVKLQQVPTCYLYQDTYAITGRTDQAVFQYIEEDGEKYFSLPFYWFVPALSGGFGIYECYLVLE